MQDSISKMVDYHLQNLVRSLPDDEKAVQLTSRIPASLKIRLDLCASYLDLTRNSFLIDLLEAALPTVEQVLRDSQSVRQECGVTGSWGPYTYDEAVKAFKEEFQRTGKEFKSISELNELINQANLEFSETGETSPDTENRLRELGYPERLLNKGDK
jgi:hypothetical protein